MDILFFCADNTIHVNVCAHRSKDKWKIDLGINIPGKMDIVSLFFFYIFLVDVVTPLIIILSQNIIISVKCNDWPLPTLLLV